MPGEFAERRFIRFKYHRIVHGDTFVYEYTEVLVIAFTSGKETGRKIRVAIFKYSLMKWSGGPCD